MNKASRSFLAANPANGAGPGQSDHPTAPSFRDTSFVTEDYLPYLLTQVMNRWDRKWRTTLKGLPVNARQWNVLAVVNRRPGLSLNELGEKTSIDQPTLSRIVENLSSLGLLKRGTAENDARFLSLSLTEDGEKLVEDVWPVSWQNYRSAVRELTPDEESILVDLLRRLLHSLEAN